MKKTFVLGLVLAAVMPALAQTSRETPPAAGSAAANDSTATAKSWLTGRWLFDEEYTRQRRGNQPDQSREVSNQLLEKMKGARLVVTDRELTLSRADGTEKRQSYTIVPGTDGNTAQIAQEDGQMLRINRDGERIWMSLEGEASQPFYFKKGE